MFPEAYTPKTLRKQHKRKQKEVAAFLGITVRQYRSKEMNVIQWYAHEIYLLAKFYGVHVDCFYKENV